MSAVPVCGLNLLIFTWTTTYILLSRFAFESSNFNAKSADSVVGTLFVGVLASVLGVSLFYSTFTSRTVGRALITAGSTVNFSSLVQLLFNYPQSGLEVFKLVYHSFTLAGLTSVAYALVLGEYEPEYDPPKRKLLDDLMGVEAKLEAIEQKIVRLKDLAAREVKASKSQASETSMEARKQ